MKIELHAGVPGHDGAILGRSVQILQDGKDISGSVRDVAVRCRAGDVITVVLEVYPSELHLTGLDSQYVRFASRWTDRLRSAWYGSRLRWRLRRLRLGVPHLP